jgi:hypothetical protein
MPDAPLPAPRGSSPELAPHLRSAARRYRCLLARGCDAEAAMAELVAYLVVLRPGLPRVLAQEQAAMIAAAVPDRPARPGRALLLALAAPARPGA